MSTPTRPKPLPRTVPVPLRKAPYVSLRPEHEELAVETFLGGMPAFGATSDAAGTPAGTTRQSGRLLLGRPGWRGKTDSHAAGDRLAPRRATGGDVNDPNWTCCSISVADSNQSVLVAAPPGLRC